MNSTDSNPAPASAFHSGIGIAIAGAALFSIKPILIKLAYAEGVDATTLMALRMGFCLPIFLLIGWHALRDSALSLRETLPLWPPIAAVGVLGYYAASYLDLWGLTMITAQFERMILFTFPTFVLLLGWALHGDRPSRRQWFALALSFLGIALVYGHDLGNLGDEVRFGTLLVLASSLCFAGYLLMSKNLIGKLGSRLFTCLAMSAASFAILIHYLLMGELRLASISSTVLGLALLIAIFATVLPSLLISEAIKRIGPGQTSIISSVGPVITSLLAVLVLDEVFGWAHAAGLALVIGGVLSLSGVKR
jgi:drug/metabolite transporter (DMT)-like permease